MDQRGALERQAVAGRPADELDVVDRPVHRCNQHLLAIAEPVDEHQRERPLAQRTVVAGGADARLQFAHDVVGASDAEALDVGYEVGVHAEAVAREADGDDAAGHHAARADLAGGRAAAHPHARERRSKGGGKRLRVVRHRKEHEQVLHGLGRNGGAQLCHRLGRGHACARRDEQAAPGIDARLGQQTVLHHSRSAEASGPLAPFSRRQPAATPRRCRRGSAVSRPPAPAPRTPR